MTNENNSNSPSKDRIFLSPKLCISCEVTNGILFVCGILLLGLGTYHLRALKLRAEECAQGAGNVCPNESTLARGSYAMIAMGCILIVFCVILISVMFVIAKETSKYLKQLSSQVPTYEEAIHPTSGQDEVWTV